MRRYWLLLGIFAGGCLASNGLQYEAMSDTNQYHLALLHKGMSEKQVLQIMHKPYSYESFEVGEDIYDVWFYVTRATGLDQTRMVPQNLTPLTFRNGVLVGMGYSWYYYAMKEQAAAMCHKPQVKPLKKQRDEDKAFEKTLDKIEKQRNPSEQPSENNQDSNAKIVSQKDIPYVPEEEEGCQNPCEMCPEAPCGPDRFAVLCKGMSETQVFHMFGMPLRYETFQIGYDVYDAWMYETFPSKIHQPSIVPQHLTILTFKNASLISTKDNKFYELKQLSKVYDPEQLRKTPDANQDVSFFKKYEAKTPLAVSQQDVTDLRRGMSEADVLKKLGAPFSQETFQVGPHLYKVWFYSIPSNTGDQTVPLTFKNGRLIGRTNKAYESIRAKASEPCEDCYDEKGARLQQDADEQNFDFW